MEIELQSNKGPQQQTTTSSNSPIPSPSSSPTHEFSFTISLHSSTTTNTPLTKPSSPSLPSKLNKQQQQQQPLAIDLTPADEIFFHGHLLPLHFLSHLHSSSPRLSTHSSDNFALQVPDYSLEQETLLKNNATDIYHSNLKSNSSSSITRACEDDYCISFNKNNDNEETNNDIIINCSSQETIDTINSNNNNNNNNKSKPTFSLFRLSKWKKGEKQSSEENNSNKIKKVKFELSQFLKRYIKMVKPLLQGGKRENYKGRRQSYSFSGTVSPRDYSESLRVRRGEYSAPASMRTSPTNSGLLMATSGVPSPVSDSTMEELQAAIQAAIAHCKNSSSSIQDNNNNNNNNNSSGSELKSQELSSIAVN